MLVRAVDSSDSELATPRRGYVLSTAVEKLASPLRAASQLVARVLARQNAHHDWPWLGNAASVPTSEDRAAWNLIAIWAVGLASGHLKANLSDSVAWFCGGDLPTNASEIWVELDRVSKSPLQTVQDAAALRALLPYVIDTHGPGSRLAVMRDPTTSRARISKKASGAFYTPADVANFMASSVLDEAFEAPPKVLDLAVGTGVFLRAALQRLTAFYPGFSRIDLAKNNLFGLDVDPIALDGAAHVLLCDCISSADRTPGSPLSTWQVIRANLAECDALLVDRHTPPESSRRVSLASIFPALHEGADIVIGNPPYALLGKREDTHLLVNVFDTIRKDPRPTANLYPIFIEQMVRLANGRANAAMVVPLSLGCNSGRQFRACREIIQREHGTWRFAFFDREPHALFGEDAKTRNVIVFWRRGIADKQRKILTGPLRKWRGDMRTKMLARIDFTPIDGGVTAGIPKIHGPTQAEAWNHLRDERVTLQSVLIDLGKGKLDALEDGRDSDVFVGPTAYNFINVARPIALPLGPYEHTSENELHKLVVANSKEADCIYALLVSNFAFWWWHVNGDGFHVNQATLKALPVGALALQEPLYSELAELGARAWTIASQTPLRSVNRRRISFSFPLTEYPLIRRDIDYLIVRSLRLGDAFAAETAAFVEVVSSARLFDEIDQTKMGTANAYIGNCRNEGKEPDFEGGVARIYEDCLVHRQ